ncbi:MAG: hypothetical protein D6731_06635 [Planctomycetota bacterium]|nr:MAG: hypothetical protein D6731_06635 [Planctomycetota bacterium]
MNDARPEDEAFPARTVAQGVALVSVSGKIRGRRARRLGQRLRALAEEGLARVVLDMRTLTSIDSLGTFALEEGLAGGLKIHLVLRPAFSQERFLLSRSLLRRGLRVHRDLDEALSAVRQIADSGICLV